MATSSVTTTQPHRRVTVLDTNLVVITVGADFSKVTIWFDTLSGYVQVAPTVTAAAPNTDAVAIAQGQAIEILREDATDSVTGDWTVGVAGISAVPAAIFNIWGTRNVKKGA